MFRILSFLLLFLISIFGQEKKLTESSSYTNPIELENPKKFYQLGNIYLGGQPDSSEYLWFVENGVTEIISLRRKKEIKKFIKEKYDFKTYLEANDINFEKIAMGGDKEYKPEMVEKFAKLVSDKNKKYLVYCKGGGRASHLWIAYLTNYKNVPLNEAVDVAKKMKVSFPFEDLLGYQIKVNKKD